MRIIGLARGLVALAVASLAVLSLTYADSAPLGQVLPAGIPGREIWLHGSAFLLLAASAGLCFSRTALPSVLIIGAYEAIWAFAGTPPIFSHPLSIGAWYGFCEALTSLVGPGILYVTLRLQAPGSEMPVPQERAVRAARVVFGLTCVFYGWSHFAYADYTASMVPTWLPGRLGFAYFTGLAHLAAGIGLVVGVLPRLAAILEALMMSLFGLLVWVPSFFMQPRPKWATPPANQWSELVVNLLLAASAWVVVASLSKRSWAFGPRSRV
jgi:uncharacterized membrane protein YphA (DoxX/SURF4 family)